MTLRRRALLPILAALALALSAAPVRAESLLWTLVATPLTATTGVATTFTVTATNEDPLAALLSSAEIGCVVVTLPSSFSISAAGVGGSSAGGSWSAAVSGTKVTVRAGSGGDRLALLDWVRFTVTATPSSAGSLTWGARAYRQQDCSGSGALLGVPPVVLVVGPVFTPTPVPTPKPTPKPTAKPTAEPTPTATPALPVPRPSLPIPSLPTPLPTPGPVPTTGPDPIPSATDGSTPRPSSRPTDGSGSSPTTGPTLGGPAATSSPAATDGGDDPGGDAGVAGPGPGGGDGPAAAPQGADAPTTPTLRFDDARLELGTGGLGVLEGLELWAVPAATIAGPGLLVLLWILVQSVGAAVWLPAARRLRSGPATSRLRRVR